MPFANLFWPSLLQQNPPATIISIVVALGTEGFFLWRVTQFSFVKVSLATIGMNVLSTVIGFAAMGLIESTLAGISGSSLPILLTWSGFNGALWIIALVLFALLDSAIEGAFVRFVFKTPMPVGGFLLLSIANMIGLAFGVMLHFVVAMARGV